MALTVSTPTARGLSNVIALLTLHFTAADRVVRRNLAHHRQTILLVCQNLYPWQTESISRLVATQVLILAPSKSRRVPGVKRSPRTVLGLPKMCTLTMQHISACDLITWLLRYSCVVCSLISGGNIRKLVVCQARNYQNKANLMLPEYTFKAGF